MTPERWHQVGDLLSAALEQEAGQRASFLAKECKGDEELRRQVELLLRAHEEAGSFLEPAEGGASSDHANELQQHVSGCEECRQVFAELGGASAGAPGSTDRTVPPSRDLSEPAPPSLAPGERVGRFQVERLVGEGGMGAVYAARDPELGRLVALKLLRVKASAGSDTAGLRSRLLREAQAMARLAHPNVVTVFDVGTLGEQVFVAMELVEGGTLTRWLREKERPWAEVLNTFLEAGRGLAAAHAAGLVHRDFKPDNVLIGADGRARVTDFGLARPFAVEPEAVASGAEGHLGDASADSSLGARLTRTGALLGTPAYMAPEQMRAQPVDARADLFSFCSSLYEALYGQRAFEAESLVDLERKIEANEVSPEPPGRAIPFWVRRELLRGLRADPPERQASMDELLAALSKGRERRARRSTLLVMGALALMALVLLAVAFRLARSQQPAAKAAVPAAGRRAVAVLTLRNLTARPEKAWLSSALAEMMSTEMASSRQLRVIPGDNVAVALKEVGLAAADVPSHEALRKMSTQLGADLILSGSFAALGATEQLRLDVAVEDARSGEALANVAEVGEESKVFELVGRAGARLRREMGVSSTEPDPAVHASFPANPEAARLFSEGLTGLRSFQPVAAKESLERAAKISPTNPRILAALAQTYTELGHDERARDAAQRAFEAAAGLPRDERLSIEGLYRRANNDRQRAVEIGRALVTFFPDDIEYRLQLGNDEIAASDRAAVTATVEALRKLPPPDGTDPRIELLESEAEYQLGDIKRSRELAGHAVSAGRALGSRRVIALGRYREGTALRKLGNQGEAAAALGEAEQLFHQLGDRRYEAQTASMRATLLADQGELTAAQERMEVALAVFRDLGNRSGQATVLNNLAIIHERQRRLALAVQRIDESIALFRDLNNPRAVANGLYNRGNVLLSQGDIEGARRSFDASLASYRQLGLKDRQAAALTGLGNTAVERGQLVQAAKLYHEAKDLQPPGEKVETSRSLIGLAYVAFEEGRLEDADALTKQAIALLRERELTDPLAMMEALRARALLGLGRREEAVGAVQRAKALLAQTKGSIARPSVAIADAFVSSLDGSTATDRAVEKLEPLLVDARHDGAIGDELDLRLAMAQLVGRRDVAIAQQHLRALANDARARGFLLVAHKAEAALKQLQK